jgi:perosamine synthetase
MKQAAEIESIVKALWRVLPKDHGPLGLHEPEFGENDRAYVLDAINSTYVSSVGAYVDRLESQIAAFTGAARAVAVVNGTAALHVALLVAGVKPGDEVLVPTLTFIATANAVSYCMATPHFVDSDEATLGLDPDKLATWLDDVAEMRAGQCFNKRTGNRIAAVVPMHVFGHPVDLDGLVALAKQWSIPIVEDAAESLGATYKGQHTGRFGLVGTLSFNGNKVVTTGGGGAVITDNGQLADRLKHLTTTARQKHAWAFVHDEVGYNYRMPNLNAALGCAQMERLAQAVVEKRALAARYREAFSNVPGVRFVDEPPSSQGNFWLNALLLHRSHAHLLTPLLERTNAEGIGTRPVWTLMHRLPMYAACPRMDLSIAEDLERRIINLPSSARLGRAYAA